MSRTKLFFLLIPAVLLVLGLALFHPAQQDAGIPAATADDRRLYLFTQGWKGEELGAEEVLIPEDAEDAVYAGYAALQQAQGLPLAAHAGESAVRYTYRLAQSGLYAELLCADGELVGAMCYDPADPVLRDMQGNLP